MQIGRHSWVAEPFESDATVTLGNFTNVAPYAKMHSRTQHPCVRDPKLVSTTGRKIPGYPKPYSENEIVLGSDVWVGRNVVLLGGITIGHGAIIGAFSVVAKDIPPYAVVVGNPAQIKRYRFDEETIASLLSIEWWNWPDEVIRERAADLANVQTFVQKYAYDTYHEETS